MRLYNRYLLSLAIAFGIINLTLAAVGLEGLYGYFIANVLTYIIISFVFMYFSRRARVVLNAVGGALFAGFLMVVVVKIVQVLSE